MLWYPTRLMLHLLLAILVVGFTPLFAQDAPLPCADMVADAGGASGELSEEDSLYADAARELLRVKNRVAAELLAHPEHGARLRHFVDLAEWIYSRDGQKVNEVFAILLTLEVSKIQNRETVEKVEAAKTEKPMLHFSFTKRRDGEEEVDLDKYLQQTLASGFKDIDVAAIFQSACKAAHEKHGVILEKCPRAEDEALILRAVSLQPASNLTAAKLVERFQAGENPRIASTIKGQMDKLMKTMSLGEEPKTISPELMRFVEFITSTLSRDIARGPGPQTAESVTAQQIQGLKAALFSLVQDIEMARQEAEAAYLASIPGQAAPPPLPKRWERMRDYKPRIFDESEVVVGGPENLWTMGEKDLAKLIEKSAINSAQAQAILKFYKSTLDEGDRAYFVAMLEPVARHSALKSEYKHLRTGRAEEVAALPKKKSSGRAIQIVYGCDANGDPKLIYAAYKDSSKDGDRNMNAAADIWKAHLKRSRR